MPPGAGTRERASGDFLGWDTILRPGLERVPGPHPQVVRVRSQSRGFRPGAATKHKTRRTDTKLTYLLHEPKARRDLAQQLQQRVAVRRRPHGHADAPG